MYVLAYVVNVLSRHLSPQPQVYAVYLRLEVSGGARKDYCDRPIEYFPSPWQAAYLLGGNRPEPG